MGAMGRPWSVEAWALRPPFRATTKTKPQGRIADMPLHDSAPSYKYRSGIGQLFLKNFNVETPSNLLVEIVLRQDYYGISAETFSGQSPANLS